MYFARRKRSIGCSGYNKLFSILGFSQIIAVIFSNTGIALLAYMDGISQTRTLGGVVLGAAAAAGSAVYKVLQILTTLWKRDKSIKKIS